MKTIKTTEKFDQDGKLIERVTETTETIEATPLGPVAPFAPAPYWPPYQPIIIGPNTTPAPNFTPIITCALPPQTMC